MKTNTKFITLYCIIFLLTTFLINAQEAGKAIPVKIKQISVGYGKPNLQFYNVEINIKNSTDSMRWYLFPDHANDTLDPAGVFKAPAPWQNGYIVGRKFPDSPTTYKIVNIHFLGEYKGFVAFCILPHSSVRFVNYTIESWGDVTAIDAWEVSGLLVDGKTPLDKWLPYGVSSTKNAYINSKKGSGSDWTNLDWDFKQRNPRKDYPAGGINYIAAKGIKKYRIAFETR